MEHREEIRFVGMQDAEYPPLLHQTHDPPPGLYLRGAPLVLAFPVAIVGTRRMTSYGARATERLVTGLVRAGCEIISGLALGIDGAAHDAALKAGGKTVAVLGGGCDPACVYPREHAGLAERIVAAGGTLVSEWPAGTKSRKHHFLMRNRIIAGLSLATVVIEAPERSGALVTARLAAEENREVFVVPGPITQVQSRGTNNFLKFGAAPCTDASDVLHCLGLEEADSVTATANVTADERALLDALTEERHADDLCRALACKPQVLSAIVTSLELKGFIERIGGDRYVRAASFR
ncbi:DNA-protecting protein DprA [Candidatus Uhrbacteria bacterium]|nr:DNA-protecting protein DprA [Candidatus Uhrbacteria bacterium]